MIKKYLQKIITEINSKSEQHFLKTVTIQMDDHLDKIYSSIITEINKRIFQASEQTTKDITKALYEENDTITDLEAENILLRCEIKTLKASKKVTPKKKKKKKKSLKIETSKEDFYKTVKKILTP